MKAYLFQLFCCWLDHQHFAKIGSRFLGMKEEETRKFSVKQTQKHLPDSLDYNFH